MYAAQADLEFTVTLPWPSELWASSHEPASTEVSLGLFEVFS